MKTHLIVLLLLIATTCTSCLNSISGNGPVTDELRELPEFHNVALNMSASVLVTQGENQSVRVYAQENLHEIIMIRVDGRTLVITSKGTIINSKPVMIEITMVNPEAFEVNGSGEIKSMNNLRSDFMDFEINGSGNITAAVTCEKLSSAVSGSGNITLEGEAANFNCEVNGSGKLSALDLYVTDGKIKVSGSGRADVQFNGRLEAVVNGSGMIRYEGTPELDTQVNGSGSVKALRKDAEN